VAGNASDPNAQGGVIKTGAGTLVLTGSSYYSGVTTIHSGTLALAAGALEQGTTVVTVGQNAGDVATLVLGSSSNLTLGGFGGAGGTDAPIVIAQDAGSTGMIIIGDGAASSGADLGARVITGGSGTPTLRFTQQFAAGSASDPLYPFYTTLTGSLALVQEGIGTTSLQPLYGANTFAGAVTVNAGVLATTGSAAALAGVTEITVNSGGTLALGQSDGVNNLAGFTLAGGVLQTVTSLSETFGALAVTGSTSLIDFLGNAATLNFATLDLGGHLSIWNYSGATDFLAIATGTATGSLEQISFYSDAGTTFLGYGGFESTRIVPVAVPEPSTIAMALAGLAAGGMLRWRRKRAASPRASSPS
jgi:autotransporter-associated beta strand protein